MIHLLHGPAGSCKSEKTLRSLGSILPDKAGSFCLIVPNQQVLDHYVSLLASQNSSILTGNHVQTYTQFLFSLLKRSLPRLHLSTARINRHLVRKILAEPGFETLSKARTQKGLLRSILKTVEALRSQGLTGNQVQSLLQDAPLSHEFGKLYESFDKALEHFHLIDQGGLTLWVSRLLDEDKINWPEGLTQLTFDRLFPINAGQRQLLKKLNEKKPELLITVNYSFDFEATEDPYLYPAYLELGELAEKSDYQPSKTKPNIQFRNFSDTISEIDWITRSIQSFLKQGVAPESIAVITDNDYATALLETFSQSNIPFHLSNSFEIISQSTDVDPLPLIPHLQEKLAYKADQMMDHLLAERLNQASRRETFEQEWDFECREFITEEKTLLSQWKEDEWSLLRPSSIGTTAGVRIATVADSFQSHWQVVFITNWTDQSYPGPVPVPFLYPEELAYHAETREVLGGPGFEAAICRHQIEQLIRRSAQTFVSWPMSDAEGRENRACRLIDFSNYQWLEASEERTEEKGQLSLLLEGSIKPKKESLFPKNKKRLFSVTELETYLKCPYQYYAKYHLKLPERIEDTTDVSGLVSGNLLHRVLHRLLKEESTLYSEAIEYDLYINRLLEKCNDIITEEAAQDKALKNFHPVMKDTLLSRLKATLATYLKEEIQALRDGQKKTKPHLFEWAFGNKQIPALTIKKPGMDISITGRIDRIDYDSHSKSFSVIDYKSGDVAGASHVTDGRAPQIPIYLMVCEEHLFKNQNLSGGFLLGFGQAGKKSGLVIKDSADSKSMTHHYQMSIDKWDEIKTRVQNVLLDTAEKIQAGAFAPSPREANLCNYCSYREICRYRGKETDEN